MLKCGGGRKRRQQQQQQEGYSSARPHCSPDVTVSASSPGLANTLVDVGAARLQGGGPRAAVGARMETLEGRLTRMAAAIAASLIAAVPAAPRAVIPPVFPVVWTLSIGFVLVVVS